MYWWADLANILHKPTDYVVFSIDGLGDTNHIYRKNVSWDRVMKNAETFINGGGNAHWDMLVYEHNQHQVDECEKLAKDMGFKWFRSKVSKRQTAVEWLKPPIGWTSPSVNYGKVDCIRNNEQSLYLNAKGTFQPCCWIPNSLDQFNELQASWDTNECNPVCKKTCGVQGNGNSFSNQWQYEAELNV